MRSLIAGLPVSGWFTFRGKETIGSRQSGAFPKKLLVVIHFVVAMAMLAEPRKKQKWSVDPRNNTWSNDESRFGQKMLEKMGWSKGKGLGAHEQGSTENIKVQIKNNTVGLGATKDHEDNWIAHQDEFNQLLSELNVCHKQNGSSVAEDKTAFSLEEKSKSSKKRVHYQKFTKGKDLSSRSAIDLACIFGKRGKQVKGSRGQEEQVMSDTCFMPDNDPEVPGDSEPKVEINTVTSSLTMQEYFANRMAQLKKPKAKHEIHQVCATQDLAGDDESSFQEVKRKRKKCSRGDANRVCSLDKQPILSKQAKSGEYVEINNDLIEDSSVKENCRSKKSSRKNSAKLLVSFDQKVCPLEEVESMIPVDQYSMVNESSEMHNEQECREDQNKQKKIKKVPYLTNEISQSCHDSTERRKKKIKKQKC